MGVGNGAVVNMGTAFFAVETVFAGLAYTLTNSTICVGLLCSVAGIGWFWPQMFVGNLIEHRERKMPLYRITVVVRLAVLLTMAAVVLLWRGSPVVLFWLLLILLAVFTSAGGACVVPFMDIIAKSMPKGRIPMLLAYRRLIGGFLGFLAGGIVAYILSDQSGLAQRQQYAVLFLLGAVFSAAAFSMFMAVREAIEPVAPQRVPFLRFLRRGPAIFRRDREYRRLYLLRCAWALATMSQALFVPYAYEVFDAPPKFTGWFTGVTMLAGGISSLIWGRFAERRGAVFVLKASIVVVFVSPLTALLLALTHHYAPASQVATAYYLIAYVVMFGCWAAGFHGNQMAQTVYLLALAPSTRRPTYVGFMNTLSVPLLAAPALGGFIAQVVSYPAAFGISCVAAVACLALALTLRARAEGDSPGPVFEEDDPPGGQGERGGGPLAR